MNRKWKSIFIMPSGHDRWIETAIILLSVYGTVMIGSASMGLSVGNNQYLLINVVKQIIFVSAGFIAMIWLANNFSIRFLKSSSFVYVVLGTVASLLMCLFFAPVGGARAWIRIPLSIAEVSLQPSEFAKISVILIIAAYCGETKKQFAAEWEMVKKPFWLVAIICGIVLILQGDFGSMAVISAVAYLCFMIPAHKQLRGFQAVLLFLGLILLVLFIYILSPMGANLIMKMSFLKEYQRNRFLSAIDPFYDRYNTGFQLIKGLTSIASGGWIGVGFGNSVNKYTQFPAANTDYILAILIEETGYIGFLFLMALYGIIIFSCLRFAMLIKNECAKVILVGTAAYLMIHMLFNIGGVTGMIPLTGVPLLMISAGGSSTMSFMMAVGICQAVISAFNRKELV